MTKQETLYFCTLFDSNYLTRGLATYYSLEKNCPNFVLYVIAFDDKSYNILQKLKLDHMIIISLSEFEDPELLKVKPTRTEQEYCWTSTSSIILYCIKKYNLDICVYIDADMIFFDNPQILLDEMGDKSVALTEHRLPEKERKIMAAGTYCVQFMPFKNDDNGMRALFWWRERCLEWCYARVEDGKYGDQKYLDDWLTRFSGIHVLKHLGGGVAPWNMYRYKIMEENNKLFVLEKKSGKKEVLIFYHFQSTKLFNIFGKIKAFYSFYNSNLNISTRNIYDFYEKAIYSALKKIREVDPNFNQGFDNLSDYFLFIIKKYTKDTRNMLSKIINIILAKN